VPQYRDLIPTRASDILIVMAWTSDFNFNGSRPSVSRVKRGVPCGAGSP